MTLQFARQLTLLACLFTVGCAGSTSFVSEDVTVDLAPGTNTEVVLEFEAIGSHAGSFDFVASVSSGEGLTASVSPGSAEVDGVVDLTVSIELAEGADNPFGSGSVFVEGLGSNGSAGMTVSVDIPVN